MSLLGVLIHSIVSLPDMNVTLRVADESLGSSRRNLDLKLLCHPSLPILDKPLNESQLQGCSTSGGGRPKDSEAIPRWSPFQWLERK